MFVSRTYNYILIWLASYISSCFAFDWGDWHIVSVVGVTFISFSLFLATIIFVLYVGFFKSFFENLKEEIAQTHREYHPWPIGSARWRLQQMLRHQPHQSESRRPIVEEKTNGQYQNIPYQHSVIQIPDEQKEKIPIIVSDYAHQPPIVSMPSSTEIPAEYRVTYFTPTPPTEFPRTSELPLADQFQEYRLIREESFTSRGSTNGMKAPFEDIIVRTMVTRQSRSQLRPTFI